MQNKLTWKESVYSEGSDLFLNIRNPKYGDKIKIGVRMFKDAPVNKVYIRYSENGEEKVALMDETLEKGKFTYYYGVIEIKEPITPYYFIICAEDNIYYYNQVGLYDYIPTDECDFKILADFKEPQWVEDSIFYQIFVDRFRNGNVDNDVKNGEYSYRGFVSTKRAWEEAPGEYTECGCMDFFGGDLEGVQEKISYLKGLGINAVFLNPIFTAPSHHKYDCSNYREVDRHFGGDNALINLIEALHKEDMKIILDISINHTGELYSWAKEKPNYYYVRPDGTLETWLGVETLLSLNYTSEELRDEIYRLQNSVLKKWLKAPFKIDGWRFDVGHNTAKMNRVQEDESVWREVRKELKELNPECYLIAEHWWDASKYLQGDMWDGVMNYFCFERPVRKYLGEYDLNITSKIDYYEGSVKNGIAFKNEVVSRWAKLPYQIQRLQFNLLGSHDIHRIHTSKYISEANAVSAVMMEMVFKGVPCVYYGDEVGLHGFTGSSEGCRFTMEWNDEKWNKNINIAYREMLKLRKEEKTLKTGCFKMLFALERAVSFARFSHEKAFVFVNSQYACYRELDIPIGILGDCKEVETLFGNGKVVNFNNEYITVALKPEESLLLKIKF